MRMIQFLHRHLFTGQRFLLLLLLGVMALGVSSFHPAEKLASGDYYDVRLVKYYPNPATTYINFEFPAEIDKSYTLLIFSFVGKKMAEMPIENNRLSVVLTDYYRGIYIFQLKDKTGKIVETGKFQVTK